MERFGERYGGTNNHFARLGEPESPFAEVVDSLLEQDIWLLFRALSHNGQFVRPFFKGRKASRRNLVENALRAFKGHAKLTDVKPSRAWRPVATFPVSALGPIETESQKAGRLSARQASEQRRTKG